MSRPIPADFAQVAPTMNQRDLRKHYDAGNFVLYRWAREAGIKFRTPAAVPEDFADNCKTMGVMALGKHYRFSNKTIRRWIRETGITPIRAKPYQPERIFTLKAAPADLAEVAKTKHAAALMRHYGVSHTLLSRWLKDAGIVAAAAPARARITKPAKVSLVPTTGRGGVHLSMTRASSVYDMAADDLRRANWVVYRCDDRGRYAEKGKMWRVGDTLNTAAELLARAERVRSKAA